MNDLFLKLLLSVVLFAQSAKPVAWEIPIPNHSFEDVVAFENDACGQTFQGTPPGWYASGGNGGAVINPTTPRPCDFSSPPDGNQMVVILNGAISVNLGDVSKMPFADANGGVDGTYKMHVFVANFFYWYPGKYSASLSLFCQPGNALCEQGTTKILCSTSGIGAGDFADIPLKCPAQRQYGQLIITLGSGLIGATGGYYQNLFDNVSLKFYSGEKQ